MDDSIVAAICKGVAAVIEAYDQEAVLLGAKKRPGEVELTAHLLKVTFPPMVHLKFNPQSQEPRVGADWLWWFVSSTGVCFGLLIQAKILRGVPGRRHIGFEHESKTGGVQFDRLLESADALGVPATYVMFYGPAHTRPDLVAAAERTTHASPWEPMTVGMLDALVFHNELFGFDPVGRASFWAGGRAAPGDEVTFTHDWVAQRAFAYSRPLLALADGAATFLWEKLPAIYPGFESIDTLLNTEQHGPARVASAVVDYLAGIAGGQFSHATSAPVPVLDDDEPVFTELPDHRGHFGRSYLPYLLRGYRRRPPAYVRDILNGGELTRPLPANVAGVAVVAG